MRISWDESLQVFIQETPEDFFDSSCWKRVFANFPFLHVVAFTCCVGILVVAFSLTSQPFKSHI